MKKSLLYRIRDARIFSGVELEVLNNIVSRIGKNSGSWPSYAEIAADIGRHRRTVIRKVERLERSGVLIVERRYRRSNLYSIDENALAEAAKLQHVIRAEKQRRWASITPARSSTQRHHVVASGNSDSGRESPRILKEESRKSDDAISNEDLQSELEALFPPNVELAFEKAVHQYGFDSLAEHLSKHGRFLFRIFIDPNRKSRIGTSGLLLVCFDNNLARHPELKILLAKLGFDEDAHWPIDAFRDWMSQPGRGLLVAPSAYRLGSDDA